MSRAPTQGAYLYLLFLSVHLLDSNHNSTKSGTRNWRHLTFYKRLMIHLEYLHSDPRSPGADVPVTLPLLLSMPLRGRFRVTPEK